MGERALPQQVALVGALAVALCLLVLLGTAGPTQADVGKNDFVLRQAIVRLKPATDNTPAPTIKEINNDYGSTTLDKLPGSTGIYLLKLPADSDTVALVNNMATDPRLVFAERNFVAEAPEGDGRHRAYGISTTKPSSSQYAAVNLNLSCAAEISRGKDTTVAVLDTGVQLGHPALKTNFEEVKRYDFVGDDRDPSDRPLGRDADGDGLKDEMVGHGTHVAGIVDLVAPRAKIMPLRVLNTEGYGTIFTIAEAISYAKRNGADVINLSLGTGARSRLLEDMVDDAIDYGVVVVAAAGNSNTYRKHYPAAGKALLGTSKADGLVAVTSVNRYEKKSRFANYGLWVDIAAPGSGIRSAFPVSVYANWSGTSMATPFVSGEAALVHKVKPSLDPAGIEERIRTTAALDALEFYLNNPDYPDMLGTGHADVCASLQP